MTQAVRRRDTGAPSSPTVADLQAFRRADEVEATWRTIAAALSPILGPRGVVAIYDHSARLAGQRHPWLCARPTSSVSAIDFESLRFLVAQQGDGAVAGTAALLQAFREVLGSLLGTALAERLLSGVARTEGMR